MFASRCKRKMSCSNLRNSFIVPVSIMAIVLTFSCGAKAMTTDCNVLARAGTKYQCDDSTRCVNASRVCDGSNDCLDWSDETNCGNQTCESYQFQCVRHNNCINGAWRCDGDKDCLDGSDEVGCPKQNCTEEQFRCSNGRCVPSSYYCDGDNDCSDNSDEPEHCPPLVCRSYQFACESGDVCISFNWACDGEEDCDDGSDERNCSTINVLECNIGQFDCGPNSTYQRCIRYSWVCDGEEDCGNGADEDMCRPGNSTRVCNAGQFACGSGECLPELWQCDGDEDCVDTSDEAGCEATCGPHQFHCMVSGRCIDGNLVCNGVSDCRDGTDEQLSSCANIIQPTISCDPDKFQCSDLSRCLTGNQHCDNRSHCADGSDELNCSHTIENECHHDNGGCAQLCHDTPTSYFCSCRHGYKINADRWSCDDIDECTYTTPCAQLCHNTNGSYYCSCVHGFTSDGPYCVNSSDGDAWLLYSDRLSLRHISTDSSHTNRELIGSLNYPISMDYHYQLGYVFWTDYAMKKIQRAHLNGSGPVTTVIDRGLEQPTGIAVDWINNKIYWSDSLTKLIEVSELDGSNRLALVWSNMELPRPIVLDPFNRYMYWSDWGVNARIERAQMDGSNRVVLHGTRLVWPNALAIDLISERLYWADAKLHVVEVSHLDGSHRQVIAEEVQHPFSMTLFGQFLYYTDWQAGGVIRVSKLTGNSSDTNNKVLLESDKITSMGIKAVHPSLQLEVENPCDSDNGGCSHLCLLSATSLGHSSCACPTGYKIDRSKKNCLPLDKFILFTRSVDIRRISLDTPSFVDVTLPVTNLQHTMGLDWSRTRNTFYWCDYLLGTINVATLEGKNQRVLISNKDSQPVGLAVDWINDKLYWTDSSFDRIEVLDLNTSQRSVLLSTELDKPRGIAIHPTRGLMFWTDWGSNAKIERANMDGSERVTLVNTSLTWPNGITIDYEMERIYWVDADNSTRAIEYCDFNGNGRTVLINQRLLHPFGITLFKDHIYWTDWETDKVERADKMTGDNRIVVHANLDKLMDITVVHNDRATVPNPCAINNGGCSYLCLLRPASVGNGLESSCVCPTGISLLDDNKTCASRIHNYVLFSVYNELKKVSLDVPHPVDEHVDVTGREITAVTIDPITEDIFFSDTVLRKIVRYSQATGETRDIPRLGGTKSEGLAVDWLSQLVYWSDIDSKTIEVSDYDGSVRSLLLTRDDGLSGPRGVALDLKNKYLFFTDWQLRSPGDYVVVIKRAAMDGSHLKTIVGSELAGFARDIFIDYQGNSARLYWTKSVGNMGSIMSTDINGKHPRVLQDSLTHSPNGLSVMLGRVFWSEWGSSKIRSADKMIGSGVKTEFESAGHPVGDIHVFTSNYTITMSDYPCRQGVHSCSHLCLPNTSNRGYRCACATGTTVEGNTCNPAPHGFIVYAEVLVDDDNIHGSLKRIPLGATSAYQTTLVSTISFNPVALEFYHTDDLNGYIYYSDPFNRYIGRVGFDGTGLVTVLTNVQTDSLAVDWVSGNLYWIDYDVELNSQGKIIDHTNFTISVSRLDGSYRKKLISRGLGDLRGLAVLPKEGKIFWNDYSHCSARIESANLDGSDRQVVIPLVDNYTQCHEACLANTDNCIERYTNQMELNYTSNELYWVDGLQDVLEAVNINGSNHRVLQNLTYCFGLGLDINDVIVTSWIKSEQGYRSLLKWHNSPSSSYQIIRNDIAGLPMDVAVVRRDKRPSGPDDLNACAVNNGGCKYLCLPVNHTHRRCACPDVLNERCTEYVGLPPTPTPTSVPMTTTSVVTSSVVVMETTSTDIIIIPTTPTTTGTPSSSSQAASDQELRGSLVAAYVVLAAMVIVLVIAVVLIVLCFVRRNFPERCPAVQQGRRNSILAVYGRFRSRKLPEETSNGWNEKPNNFIDQLPTTKQLSAPLGGACVTSRVIHKNTKTKDSDTLFPKTVNVKAPMNVDPATPPSPLSPNDEAALVRIEESKVVFETKI